MAKQKKEIKTMDISELRTEIKREKKALSDLYLDHSQFKLKNTREIFMKRKEIARLSTIFKIKELTK